MKLLPVICTVPFRIHNMIKDGSSLQSWGQFSLIQGWHLKKKKLGCVCGEGGSLYFDLVHNYKAIAAMFFPHIYFKLAKVVIDTLRMWQ